MLTVRQHVALSVADRLARRGARRVPIFALTGYTETRLHQVVGALLDNPDALAERPEVVARLRRIRDLRATQRRRRAS